MKKTKSKIVKTFNELISAVKKIKVGGLIEISEKIEIPWNAISFVEPMEAPKKQCTKIKKMLFAKRLTENTFEICYKMKNDDNSLDVINE